MRLHRNLCYAVIDGLHAIFNEEHYADKVVQQLLKRDKRWGSRDRGFIADTVYTIVRYKRLYAEIAEVKAPFDRDNLWRMFAVWAVLKGIQLPDWKYFQQTPNRKIKGRFDELSKTRVFRESIPDWMDNIATQEIGEELWTKEIKAQNTPAQVVLRTNTLKSSRTKLIQQLSEEQIASSALKAYDEAIVLDEKANVFKTDAFKQGLFEVQDASSQKVARFLEVEPGMKVVDACAGAGGKTLHLAALMENKGQITAMDIYESKLKKLKVRARRNGVHNIDLKVIDSTKPIKKLHNKADRLLIDAPCSGLGVLRRNPDSKWKLQPEFIEDIKAVQAKILRDYSKMVKIGGKMVYATCSILPSENQNQIKSFLDSEQGKHFKFEKDLKILAHQSGFDGFYMALLTRVD